MAVVSIAFSVAALELRSAALSLIAVVLKTTDLAPLAREIEQRASLMPGLFDDEPVAIDLSNVNAADQAPDFPALIALFRRHRMLPVAVRGGNAQQMAAASAAGLVEAPEGARPARETVFAPPLLIERITERITERVVEVQLPAKPPMIVERPLRSGQQVYARDCDLVVLALVSDGAEVKADGHIHVYAPLRGRAFAGAAGNTEARIFSSTMQAQLLAIAGVVRTFDEPLPADVLGQVAMARLADGELIVEALLQRA